jgi:hypothetical protein
MPRFLIHVGPHKTGTTYLQFGFDAARERLRQHGVAYPSIWSSSESEPSHRKLMVALREGRSAELQTQFAAIERTSPESVLISGEGLNHLDQPALALLRSLLGGHEATVIFYCRRWSELLPSIWQEKVKHGFDETFPEFLAGAMSDPFASDVMNFGIRLDIYTKVFGRKNLRLVSYNNVCDSGADLLEHFFDHFLPGHRWLIDALPGLPSGRPNSSLSPPLVEVIRALNAFAARSGDQPRGAALRSWFITNAGRFDLADLYSAMQRSAATLHISDDSPGLLQMHEAVSAAYGDLMVEPAAPPFLFAPRAVQCPYIQQRYLTDARPRQALEDIHTTYRRETGLDRLPAITPGSAPS